MWYKLWLVLQPVKFLAALAEDSRLHFLSSASLGSLAWLLTSIISCALLRLLDTGTPRRESTGADFYMLPFYIFLVIFWLGVPIAVAVLAHGWLDGILDWYTIPLGPHLELNY